MMDADLEDNTQVIENDSHHSQVSQVIERDPDHSQVSQIIEGDTDHTQVSRVLEKKLPRLKMLLRQVDEDLAWLTASETYYALDARTGIQGRCTTTTAAMSDHESAGLTTRT